MSGFVRLGEITKKILGTIGESFDARLDTVIAGREELEAARKKREARIAWLKRDTGADDSEHC